MSELAFTLVGVFFGACLAYILDLRKAGMERSHQAALFAQEHAGRRAALATALLVDLRTVESTLRQFYQSKNPAKARAILPSLFFDRVEHELVIFAPAAVAKVLAVYTSARDFFAVLEHGKRGVLEEGELGGDLDWVVRVKAGFALQALPAAVEALKREGGVLPPERRVPHVLQPNLPPIGDRVFPRALADPSPEFEERIE